MSGRGNAVTDFFGDLLWDLRDRRLLPLVALLAAALVAVPVFLKVRPEAPPPPPPAQVVPGTDRVVPAVLVAQDRVRDYRKRLDLNRAKDPFGPAFSAPAPPSGGGGLVDVTESSGGGETQAEPASEPVSEPSGSGSGTESSSSGVTPTGGSAGGEKGEVEGTTILFAYRVDVKVGPSGEAKPRKGVKELTLLPSDSRPVAMFLGATGEGGRAVFLLSSDVTGTSGDGSCLPSARDCQFLSLKQGDKRTLQHAPEGEEATSYTIELTGIHLEKVKKL